MISLRYHTGNEASGRNKIVQGSIDFQSMCGMTDTGAKLGKCTASSGRGVVKGEGISEMDMEDELWVWGNLINVLSEKEVEVKSLKNQLELASKSGEESGSETKGSHDRRLVGRRQLLFCHQHMHWRTCYYQEKREGLTHRHILWWAEDAYFDDWLPKSGNMVCMERGVLTPTGWSFERQGTGPLRGGEVGVFPRSPD